MLALAASAHGLCPACLLSTALAAPMSEDPDAGSGPAGDDGLASVPYQIVTLLDRDARSVTYLAHPLGPSRHVALRITAPRDDVADVVSRFRQWRGALAHERHPGLSRLLDVGPAGDGSLYLASDYIAGASLTTLLQRGALAEHERSTIGSQLVEVVESAHARGLAHMDLSAARVKVATADRLRATILGFGVRLVLDGVGPEPARDVAALARLLLELGLQLPEPTYASAAEIRLALTAHARKSDSGRPPR
jgi:serine/threonine protein kinase